MTAVRSRGDGGWSDEVLVITDPDGDILVVDRLVTNSRASAGVERYVPGDGAS